LLWEKNGKIYMPFLHPEKMSNIELKGSKAGAGTFIDIRL